MTAQASVLQQPDIRTLEEIEREISAIKDRRAILERETLPALRAAVKADGDTYKAALIQATRYDRPRPSRASLDTAEAELRNGEEHLAAFDGAVQAIEPERRRAEDRQLRTQRDAYLQERETMRRDSADAQQHAARWQQVVETCEQRILVLNQEIARLEMRVGPPSHS